MKCQPLSGEKERYVKHIQRKQRNGLVNENREKLRPETNFNIKDSKQRKSINLNLVVCPVLLLCFSVLSLDCAMCVIHFIRCRHQIISANSCYTFFLFTYRHQHMYAQSTPEWCVFTVLNFERGIDFTFFFFWSVSWKNLDAVSTVSRSHNINFARIIS